MSRRAFELLRMLALGAEYGLSLRRRVLDRRALDELLGRGCVAWVPAGSTGEYVVTTRGREHLGGGG